MEPSTSCVIGDDDILCELDGISEFEDSSDSDECERENECANVSEISDSDLDDSDDNGTPVWYEVIAPEEDIPVINNIKFSEYVGPKHCPPKNSKPIDYFNLFFTFSFLQMLADETNRYARIFF